MIDHCLAGAVFSGSLYAVITRHEVLPVPVQVILGLFAGYAFCVFCEQVTHRLNNLQS